MGTCIRTPADWRQPCIGMLTSSIEGSSPLVLLGGCKHACNCMFDGVPAP